MEIEILRHHLERGVQQTQHTASRQTTLPVLSCILLTTEKGRLKFSATDLEIGVQFWVPCKVKKEGKTTVPARTFSQFISTLHDEKVSLKTKDSVLEVKTQKTTAKIKTVSPDDFPIIPSVRKEKIASLPAQDFATACRHVLPFVSTSEMRPEITGIALTITSTGEVTLATTDSFRLSEQTFPKKTATDAQDFSVIVPSKTVSEIIRLFSESEQQERLIVYAEENQVLFQGESAHLVTRLIEGSYPSYASLIPTSTQTTATISKQHIIEALKASGIFTGTKQDVTLSFKPKQKTLTVIGRDVEHGENTVVLEGDIEGDETEITFNYRYLLDGLSHITTDDVRIGVNDPSKPGILTPTTKKRFLYIIMPIKDTMKR